MQQLQQRHARAALLGVLTATTLTCTSAALRQVYEKDSSKLTMKERLAAKARKEDMLARSCAVAGTGSGTATAAGGVEQ